MSAHEAFWEQVDAALDARRDPLEEPEVQRLLAELCDPAGQAELLDQLAGLRTDLARLRAAGRRRVRVRVAAALLLAAAALVATWSIHPSDGRSPDGGPPPGPTETTGAATSAADRLAGSQDPASRRPVSHVLAFRSELIEEGPRGRRTTLIDGEHTTIASEWRSRRPDPLQGAATSPALVFVATARAISPAR